jgi:hypothetical protein
VLHRFVDAHDVVGQSSVSELLVRFRHDGLQHREQLALRRTTRLLLTARRHCAGSMQDCSRGRSKGRPWSLIRYGLSFLVPRKW